MKESLKEWFEAHPEATEVHVALGYLCETEEEAKAKLAGVQGYSVETYVREQVENMFAVKPVEAVDHKLLAQFKKVPVEKMGTLIEQQETLVAKKEAAFKSEVDQAKATRSLDFHKQLLSDMKSAFAAKQEGVGK